MVWYGKVYGNVPGKPKSWVGMTTRYSTCKLCSAPCTATSLNRLPRLSFIFQIKVYGKYPTLNSIYEYQLLKVDFKSVRRRFPSPGDKRLSLESRNDWVLNKEYTVRRSFKKIVN